MKLRYLLWILTPLSLVAQQDYVGRYGVTVGYQFLDSPRLGLFENGVQIQAGINPRTWYVLGFDYSFSSGDPVVTPGALTPGIQRELGGVLGQLAAAGALPAGYALSVPAHSRTETYAAGAQLMNHHFSFMTLFIRPSLGVVHESVIPKPADPIAAALVAELAPSGRKEWTGFYGVGGGFDLIVTKHIALRVQADVAYNRLFSDLLQYGRVTVRFGIGPYFSFGKNIVK